MATGMPMPARMPTPLPGSWVLGLVMAVGGLLVMVASFYLIIKIAGLVNALAEKIKEMKL